MPRKYYKRAKKRSRRRRSRWSAKRYYYRRKKWSRGSIPLGTKAEVSSSFKWAGTAHVQFPSSPITVSGQTWSQTLNNYSIAFNPMIGNICSGAENQKLMKDEASGKTVVVQDSDNPSSNNIFTPSYFINLFYNENFRKMLCMYQEWKINYVMLKVTPVCRDTVASSFLPMSITSFVDRKYTGLYGSPVERYIHPAQSPQAVWELQQDIASQGKKWKTIQREAGGSYKVYLKASGTQEKTYWYTTEMQQVNWGGLYSTLDYKLCVKQFYCDAISPCLQEATRHNQQGFCPTILLVCARPLTNDSTSDCSLTYEVEVGCSFRNPGKWNDGKAGDQLVWNWLQAPTYQINEVVVGYAATDPHTEQPTIPTADPWANRLSIANLPGEEPTKKMIATWDHTLIARNKQTIYDDDPDKGKAAANAAAVTAAAAAASAAAAAADDGDEEPDDTGEEAMIDEGPVKKKSKKK
jgi:hypothetical protein